MKDYASLDDAVTALDPRNERPFRCHVHQDSQASASVNVAKGLWICYGCGAKGKVDGTVIQVNTDNLVNEIYSMLGEDYEIESEGMLNMYRQGDLSYWRSRFTEAAVAHFQLGYDGTTGQPVYPIWNSAGEYLGVVRRNLEDHPKYKYPRHTKTHEQLYNYSSRHRKAVVLVEGAIDAIACWEAGVDAFGIYGSHLGTQQLRLIERCDPHWVYLCFDNDAAGKQATEDAQEMFRDTGINTVVFPWKYYPLAKDIEELSIEERERTFAKLLTSSVAV
jgi:DNA primase